MREGCGWAVSVVGRSVAVRAVGAGEDGGGGEGGEGRWSCWGSNRTLLFS